MNTDWPVCKLSDLADVRVSNVDKKFSRAEVPVRLCNYMDVYENDYVTESIDFMTASASQSEIDRFGLRAGDVVITKDSETPDDIGVPAIVSESIDGLVCGYHLALIRPMENIDSIYLAKQLATTPISHYFGLNASGSTRFGLSVNVIENTRIPIAPRPEQTRIAKILFTVDCAIEQTKALITKQQRIRLGLMWDLLTRGIDEHGNLRSERTHKFKDSPLGRIPKEWDVVNVEDIAAIATGDKDTQDAEEFGAYPFFVRSQKIERISSYSLDGESVLTAGDGVGVGKVFHYHNGPFDFHQRVYCIHSFAPDMAGCFFFQYFRLRFMDRVSQFSAKGSVESVRMEMISRMMLPKPDKNEQIRSAEILKKTESFEVLYESTLEKLRSLKIALMQILLRTNAMFFSL